MMYSTLVETLKSCIEESDDEEDAFEAIETCMDRYEGDFPNDESEDAWDLLYDAVSSHDLHATQEAIFRLEEALLEEE